MTRRTGAPGCLTSPGTGGSTRDPQLPWGSCCDRKTLWRLPVHSSDGHRHALRSREFSGAEAPSGRPARFPAPHDPLMSPDYQRAFCLGQQSRRSRPACPTRTRAYSRAGMQSTVRFRRQRLSTVNVENMLSDMEGGRNEVSASQAASSSASRGACALAAERALVATHSPREREGCGRFFSGNSLSTGIRAPWSRRRRAVRALIARGLLTPHPVLLQNAVSSVSPTLSSVALAPAGRGL